jgi:hypothetical protein
MRLAACALRALAVDLSVLLIYRHWWAALQSGVLRAALAVKTTSDGNPYTASVPTRL